MFYKIIYFNKYQNKYVEERQCTYSGTKKEYKNTKYINTIPIDDQYNVNICIGW